MNGKMIGKRAVRTNWASRRYGNEGSGATQSDEEKTTNGGVSSQQQESYEERQRQLYERIHGSTDAENTTVYLGNLGRAEQPRIITGKSRKPNLKLQKNKKCQKNS